MAGISFRGVAKSYGGDAWAVRDVDLEVEDGELVVLLGPSGCGKTTLLRLVAGLETLTQGEIRVGERVVNDLPPAERDVAMIFQSYALYPHKTVRQNLEFPLRMRRVSRGERARRILEVARLLDLEPLLDARPGRLSGGQQQRVAIGRALVREPAAFLMDEPLSNLDAQLRARIRAELAHLQRSLGITTLFVTHDQAEAMTLGHRVAVLREGALQQVGPPEELYRRPAHLFVAWFVGQPAMNLVRARVAARDGTPVLEPDLAAETADPRAGAAAAPAEERAALATTERHRAALAGVRGGAVAVGVRPEALELLPAGRGALGDGTVVAVEALGPERLVHVRTPLASAAPDAAGGPATRVARAPAGGPAPRVEERVGLGASPEAVHLFGTDGRALAPG
ncbi:MAG TPA: ABC transporter ATP-binding protein [Longimicrobiales bacterium]|nr:ABC transporter ATP-binding protein [Longimicrobiales bacterium]